MEWIFPCNPMYYTIDSAFMMLGNIELYSLTMDFEKRM